mgnify:CR=1 FL=1|jgi:uncharacterized protein YehS (DUF1456 family)
MKVFYHLEIKDNELWEIFKKKLSAEGKTIAGFLRVKINEKAKERK